jgi:hypothetical protein
MSPNDDSLSKEVVVSIDVEPIIRYRTTADVALLLYE